ncbi:GNAT family N-acetyltransferase, partial [Streptomyces solincola]|uniref:GNAT family N-acetyltransferase n=1 Tax=Streptomyces solincola TaxID=2100817 RepID=UPI000D1C748A
MTHAVIVNARRQYAVWPCGFALPRGWHATGWSGAEQTCLALVSELWHDAGTACGAASGTGGAAGRGRRARSRTPGDERHAPVLLAAERLWLREASVLEARMLAAGGGAGLLWPGAGPWPAVVRAADAACRAVDAGRHGPGWGLYLLLRTEDAQVVGTALFTGPPRQGTVELILDLHPSAAGDRGYAGEALAELARWSLLQSAVRQVVVPVPAADAAARAALEHAGAARRWWSTRTWR